MTPERHVCLPRTVEIWAEVAEWEEPRHSGPWLEPGTTVTHFPPPCNTFPHRSVRAPLGEAGDGHGSRIRSGIERWGAVAVADTRRAGKSVQAAALHGVLQKWGGSDRRLRYGR